MTQYAASLYCSAVTRKWTNDENEDHILFILCDASSGKALYWNSAKGPAANSIHDSESFKPLPLVKGAILNSPKMASYPWSQLKEFIHMVPYREEFGDGVSMGPKFAVKSDAPKSARGLPTAPAPTENTEGPRSVRVLPTAPTTTENTEGPRSARSLPTPVASAPAKPRDPVVDAIKLSDASVSFLNEPDVDYGTTSAAPVTSRSKPPVSARPPNAPPRAPPLSQAESSQISNIFDSLDSLMQLVEDFDDAPQPSQQPHHTQLTQTTAASSFSDFGVASFFGMQTEFEDEKLKPPKVERKKPPPTAPRSNRAATSTPPVSKPPITPASPPPASLSSTSSTGSSSSIPGVGLPDTLWESQGIKLLKSDWMELVGKGNSVGLGNGIMNTFSAVFNLVHKAKKTTPPIFFTNCDFYANTLKDAPKSYNYVEENDLPSFEQVFIPIKEGSHCTLGVISDHYFDFYDSIGKPGDDIAKNLSKFFKECAKAKKDSQIKKGISKKSWDSLKIQQMIDAQLQKRQGDGAIFVLYFTLLLSEKKTLQMPTDGRSKLCHKLIEMLQYIKPLDSAILREMGTLADSAPQVETEIIEEKKGRGKRKTFAPGSIQTEEKDSKEKEKDKEKGRKRKGSN